MCPERGAFSCPHCGATLQAFTLPDNTGWDAPFQLACFNDECPYYLRGWTWMEEKFGVKSSYRYRIDPATGHASPIAVWSATALRDRIIGDDAAAPARDAGVIPENGSGQGGEGI